MDIFELRDIMNGVDSEVDTMLDELESDFDAPDILVALALMGDTMPPEAEALLDDQTRNAFKEVRNGKKSSL